MSLAEVLVAAALLLGLTTVVLGVLVPLMRRSMLVDDRQERQQRLVFLREELNRQLQRGWVTEVQPDFTTFYLPDTTGDLHLARLTPEGVTAWRTGELHRFALEGSQLVESWPNGRRLLWDLGPGASLRLDASGLPLLLVEVGGQQGGVWRQTLGIVLQHYTHP